MSDEGQKPAKRASDVAFSEAVKGEQEKRGSRALFERMEKSQGWPDRISPELAHLLGQARSFYLGTSSAEGQPYIQHRGGPPGFLKVLDERTLGFADLAGNRQYITTGNLSENPRAFIFLMDYARRLRIKLWGTARVVEDDDDLLSRLRPPQATSAAERSILFTVDAWDRNCRQHIPQLIPAEWVEAQLGQLQERIATLEQELQRARSDPSTPQNDDR